MSDARAISEVHVRSWQDAYAGLLPDDAIAAQSLERRLAIWSKQLETPRAPEDATWVLEADGRVVGFAYTGSCRDVDRMGAEHWELFAIYLVSEVWRRGLGRALALHALKEVPLGARTVSLWVLDDNLGSIRFYEALGFHRDGVVREERFGDALKTVIRLLRPLPIADEQLGRAPDASVN